MPEPAPPTTPPSTPRARKPKTPQPPPAEAVADEAPARVKVSLLVQDIARDTRDLHEASEALLLAMADGHRPTPEQLAIFARLGWRPIDVQKQQRRVEAIRDMCRRAGDDHELDQAQREAEQLEAQVETKRAELQAAIDALHAQVEPLEQKLEVTRERAATMRQARRQLRAAVPAWAAGEVDPRQVLDTERRWAERIAGHSRWATHARGVLDRYTPERMALMDESDREGFRRSANRIGICRGEFTERFHERLRTESNGWRTAFSTEELAAVQVWREETEQQIVQAEAAAARLEAERDNEMTELHGRLNYYMDQRARFLGEPPNERTDDATDSV